jgi:hypothetical protein
MECIMAASSSSSAPARQRPRYEDDPAPQLVTLLRQAFPGFSPNDVGWFKVESAVKEVHWANHRAEHDAFCREYFELTGQALIKFLRAEGMLPPAADEAAPVKKQKPFRNITECLLAVMSTAGGRERIEACGTLQDVCDYIHQEHPDQPATPQLLKCPGAWPGEEVGGIKWRWSKSTKRPGRTVATASRLAENLDLSSFEGRRPAPALRQPPTARLRCAACDDVITEAPVQHDGKVYCQPCGNEKLFGDIPPP